MNLDNRQIVKIFAHDAASANVVLAYLYYNYNNKKYKVIAYPKGPTINIFNKEIKNIADIRLDEDYDFKHTDIIITGLSGVLSNYELEVIKLAKQQEVKEIISILDVARSIDDRFNIDGNLTEYLPHKILVPSRNLFLSKYKEINKILQYQENLYWRYIYEKSYKLPPKITNDFINKKKYNYIVFFTEYIKEQFGNTLGYDEFSILVDFFDIFKDIDIPIFVKLHPIENKNKYDRYIPKKDNIYIIKDEITTQELLYYSKVVFGYMSSVFYEAILLNKKCYSLQIDAKKDIFELTIEEKIEKIQTKQELQNLYKELTNG